MKPREERLRYWRDVALASASCGGRIYKGWQSVFFFFYRKRRRLLCFQMKEEMK
jgi:hypothetical protein